MTIADSDNKPDIRAAVDGDEPLAQMEPLVLSSDSRHRQQLSDLALELAGKSAGLRRSLPEGVLKALADLVRAMNCYYSNLIEGHDTHPVDIERALRGDYSTDRTKRNLQLEAEAHIAVQLWIDEGGLTGRAVTSDGILDIHKRFCDLMPDDLLWTEDPKTGERIKVVGGELRSRDVQVGEHVAINPGALPRFVQRYEQVYSRLGRSETVLAAAAAHHRLLWIHPFLDGNGRVARLVSYAQLLETLDTGGVWSIARGLARNEAAYKRHLIACDQPRQNDLDGRGNLSEEALAAFSRFFLETCLDQVTFMESLVQPNQLRKRILLWAEEEIRSGTLPSRAGLVLEAVLYRGELPRADIAGLLGVGDRQGRRVVAGLIESGVLTARSDRAPLRISFPAALAWRWMPGLFPDRVGS